MANLTAEQYDTLQEMLKVITEARQTSERLSESWAKWSANPIGSHTTHLTSPITPMTPSQSPQPPDPPDLLLVDPEAAKMVDTRTQSLIDVDKQLAETHTTQLEQLQKQSEESTAWRAEIDERFMDIKNMRADPLPRESSVTLISYPMPTKPPDPPDISKSEQNLAGKAIDPPNFTKSDLIYGVKAAPGKTKASTRKLLRKCSCEQVYERMDNGLCVFCEEQDTPGHYNLKHKRSQILITESEDEQLSDDNNLVEPALEEIVDEPMEKTVIIFPNPEKESQSEVSVSQFQVPLSSMEPSRRCRNNSLDVVDERMSNELVCGKDGDYILTVSSKFREIYEDPQFELVCLKQSHNPVENHLDNFEFALTRSSLRHTPTDQYRAPFNPYQNCNDQCHYKREFGNYTGPELEFNRENEEIEDDELQERQPDEDVETLVMSENEQSLESVADESFNDEKSGEIITEGTAIELVEKSGYKVFKEGNLNSLLLQECHIVLLHFKESSDTIVPRFNLDTRVLFSHLFAGGITLLSKMVCAVFLPFLTMNIDSRTIYLNSRNIFVDDAAVALRRTVEDRFVPRMEEIYLESTKQNLEFAIDRGWVKFWINTHDFTLRNYGLRLSPSEYTKNTFILVYHLSKHSTSCLFLNTSTGCIVALSMVYDAKGLIQSDAPPIFSDLLCVKNRIRVRLKMVLLLEILWLIHFTSKMLKSSHVPQNKNQTDQKLSSYWKLLLRLFYPLHNIWGSFYWLMIKHVFKGKEETVSFNIAVTSCSSDAHILVARKKGTEIPTACCYGLPCGLDFNEEIKSDTFMDDFKSVCKLLLGAFVLNLIVEQTRDWSFFGLLLQWKWHPPPQNTSDQAHNAKPSVFQP